MRIRYRLVFWFIVVTTFGTGCKEKETPEYTPAPKDKEPKEEILVSDCKQCIMLAEQSQTQVAIADVESQSIIWSWKPEDSNIQTEHLTWFSNISDAKLVYDGEYIITCASGGGVALVRIADKKTLFYAYAGGNTHSVEILPDGNLVSASSTGDYLTIFKVDTVNFPENVYSKTIPIAFGHNVVWDRKNELLWSAANNELKGYAYNFNCETPDLALVETINLPGQDAHDLFPVYGEDALWLTNTTNIYKFDIPSKQVSPVESEFIAHIKSISSGPKDFPTILIKPKESWWTDEVVDLQGNSVYYHQGLKIYKARWLVKNEFSYPEGDEVKVCGQ